MRQQPERALYVIFTSGSTGLPKGVVNTQAALQNRLNWMQQEYALNESDCVLQKTPFSFDVSVWEFFWPLMTGARLAIAPPESHRQPNVYRSVQRAGDDTSLCAVDAECIREVKPISQIVFPSNVLSAVEKHCLPTLLNKFCTHCRAA